MNKFPPIPILYEDDDMLAINKPAGVMVHADGRSKEKTIADWAVETYPSLKGVGEPLTLASGEVIERPGIVHRLDRDTTGVLLIAKTQQAFLHLKLQFQDRHMEKRYIAILYGNLPDDHGVIDRPIGKSRKDFRLWSAQRGAKGAMREASTVYDVLGRSGGYSVVAAQPKTGRTHQIRVHFKAINHPVVCDPLYAPKRPCVFGFTRTALHAQTLTFTQGDGTKQQVEAPLPPDFLAALQELGLQNLL